MIRDMTRGNVTRHLVSFSVPIILGNLFQLAYNAVDSIVVGRFAGTGAQCRPKTRPARLKAGRGAAASGGN